MKTFFFPTVELHLQKKKKKKFFQHHLYSTSQRLNLSYHFTNIYEFRSHQLPKCKWKENSRVVYGLRMPVCLCSLWLAEVGVSHCSSSSASSTLCEEPGWCRDSSRETVPSPDMEYLSSTEVFFNQGITKAIAKRPWNTYMIVTWSNTNSNLKINNFFPPEGRSFPLLFFPFSVFA